MKDFSDYKPNGKVKSYSDGDAFATFAELASKYEGKSSDEMMSAILTEAEKGRKNGTLTDEDVDNFAAAIEPLLNDKQRRMLGVIIARLKRK